VKELRLGTGWRNSSAAPGRGYARLFAASGCETFATRSTFLRLPCKLLGEVKDEIPWCRYRHQAKVPGLPPRSMKMLMIAPPLPAQVTRCQSRFALLQIPTICSSVNLLFSSSISLYGSAACFGKLQLEAAQFAGATSAEVKRHVRLNSGSAARRGDVRGKLSGR